MRKISILLVSVVLFILIFFLSKSNYNHYFKICDTKKECCIDSGIESKFIVVDKTKDLSYINEDELKSKNRYLVFIPIGEKNRKQIKKENMSKDFIFPVIWRGITSQYGMRCHPIKKEMRYHTGVDLRAYYTDVIAPNNAKVVFAGIKSGYGKIIILQHSNGYETRLAHLSEIYVEENRYVKKGDIIGKSGNTGLSTAPHLHYELRKDGIPRNPLIYTEKN